MAQNKDNLKKILGDMKDIAAETAEEGAEDLTSAGADVLAKTGAALEAAGKGGRWSVLKGKLGEVIGKQGKNIGRFAAIAKDAVKAVKFIQEVAKDEELRKGFFDVLGYDPDDEPLGAPLFKLPEKDDPPPLQ